MSLCLVLTVTSMKLYENVFLYSLLTVLQSLVLTDSIFVELYNYMLLWSVFVYLVVTVTCVKVVEYVQQLY